MTLQGQLEELISRLSEPSVLAEAFCELDDDAQARFFVHVARLMAARKNRTHGESAGEMQAWYIGKHLAECECSTELARQLIRNIANAMGDADA